MAPTHTVPVLVLEGTRYSGFHQGAGEMTIAELLEADLPQYSIVWIDEIESSLHPRSSQRRLIRDLAEKSRERELKMIIATDSRYVLAEPREIHIDSIEEHHGKFIIGTVKRRCSKSELDLCFRTPTPDCWL